MTITDKKLGVVYKLSIINTPYFLYGSSLYFKKRIKSYLYDLNKGNYSNSFLQNIYNKHGKEVFEWKIVQDNIHEDLLEYVEDIWIGANCSKKEDNKGGINMRDAKRGNFSTETREKMSNAKKGKKSPLIGRKLPEEVRKNISISLMGKPSGRKGKKMSEEAKLKMAEIRLNNPNKKHRISPMKGKKHSEITKKKQSEAKKNKPINWKSIDAMVKANKGIKRTEEQKKRLSEAKKGTVMSKEAKEKMKIAKIGFKHSEETKKRMGKSRKGKKKKFEKRSGVKILQFDANMNFIKEWDKITNAMKELNILYTSISNCLNNRSKTAGGFIWKYKNKKHVN